MPLPAHGGGDLLGGAVGLLGEVAYLVHHGVLVGRYVLGRDDRVEHELLLDGVLGLAA